MEPKQSNPYLPPMPDIINSCIERAGLGDRYYKESSHQPGQVYTTVLFDGEQLTLSCILGSKKISTFELRCPKDGVWLIRLAQHALYPHSSQFSESFQSDAWNDLMNILNSNPPIDKPFRFMEYIKKILIR